MTDNHSERGAALPMIAIMLVVLLGMAAFAVDLGWLYLNASRLQRTADAAALAGVVNLPSDPGQAESDAIAAAGANGFPIGISSSLASIPLPDAKHQVDMTTSVPTFFLNVFGMSSVDISKTSTAQYIRPVPLGSRGNCFGCPGSGFWGAVNGQRTDKVDGDAFLSECIGNKSNRTTCPTPNGEHRDAGYFYGVDVPEGATSVTVEVFNGTYDPGPFDPNGPSDMSLSGGPEFGTTFTLRDVDTTPYSPGETAAICTQTYSPSGGATGWSTLCTVSAVEGIYVLQVQTPQPAQTSQQQGTNQYAVRATADAGAARVYALNEMSIFNNRLGTVSSIDLAEIEAVHAGKQLEIRLFDPGDISGGSGNIYLEVMSPTGSVPCSVNGAAQGRCRMQVANSSGNLYNGQWIDIVVDIDNGYACGADCWWYVDYDLAGGEGGDIEDDDEDDDEDEFTGNPTDRTTWTARVIGSPVRLVPNAP